MNIEELNISRKTSIMADELAYLTNDLPHDLKQEAMHIVHLLNKFSVKLGETETLKD